MSLLNLYPAIPLEPLPFAAAASVTFFAITVILFVVLVAVGVNVFGANLSMFVTLNVPVPPIFTPSVYRYVIVQLLLTVNCPVYCVLSFVGFVPSVVYLVVNPLFVGNVIVTFPFVHVVGLYVPPVAVSTVPVPLLTLPCLTFPALSFASTFIV